MSGTMTAVSAAGESRSAKTQRRTMGAEPLVRFTEAKKHMGEIYSDLDGYVHDLQKFLKDLDEGQKFVPEKQSQEVDGFIEAIKTIKEMFGRDSMKVVFFGRTSNGKSSVINAMLHAKVLPQGMGHTTSSFLQVEGGADNEKYLISEDSEEKMDFELIHNLGHALSSENSGRPSMGTDALVRVIYPKAASRLLQNDVVLLDSPGVDLSPEFDGWIDKHCKDADVFVLVSNAEATLTQAEKSFFERVSRLLSRPNVFILNNRWDASASEMDQHVDQVRQQHLTRFRQFLVDELKVCSFAEAAERIFFVSAREMLDARLKEKGVIERAYQMDGHAKRQQEFLNFETQFEKIISKSAIRTKFEAHLIRAREIVSNMRHNLEVVNHTALHEKQKLALDLELKNKEFSDCRENFKFFENHYIEQQHSLRAEVHLKVSSDFHDEICQLEAIIDRYEGKFSDEPHQIAIYKKLLAEHIDECVTNDLEARCTGGLMTRIWNLERNMFENIQKILKEPYANKIGEVWRYRSPFKFTINVNCPLLVEDFQEDLEFRFSLGPSAIIRRIIAYQSGQPITAIAPTTDGMVRTLSSGAGMNRQISESYQQRGPPQKQQSYHDFQYMNNQSQNQLANAETDLVQKMFFSAVSYAANGSLALAIGGGLIYKTLGPRYIAYGAAIYGGLYCLERFRWNSNAKEQHLKDQFQSHLAAKMKQAAAMHTAHCETQVLREMEQVHEGLKATVAGAHREMKENLDVIKKDIVKIEDVMKELSVIKGKTTFLNTSIDQFEGNYLKPESPQ